jgi:hypothetical protein
MVMVIMIMKVRLELVYRLLYNYCSGCWLDEYRSRRRLLGMSVVAMIDGINGMGMRVMVMVMIMKVRLR